MQVGGGTQAGRQAALQQPEQTYPRQNQRELRARCDNFPVGFDRERLPFDELLTSVEKSDDRQRLPMWPRRTAEFSDNSARSVDEMASGVHIVLAQKHLRAERFDKTQHLSANDESSNSHIECVLRTRL